MILEIAMDLMQPRMLQHIVDHGIPSKDLTYVVHSGLLMLLFAVLGLFGGAGCTAFAVLAGQGLGFDLRRDLFNKVQSLSYGNLDRLQTGSLVTRLTNDVAQVQEVAMIMMRMMVRAPLLMVGSAIMATLTSPRLALIFLAIMPVMVIFLSWIVKATYPVFGAAQAKLDRLNTILQENISGVRVVKAFSRAEFEKERFGVTNRELADHNLVAARLGSLTMPVVMLSMNLGVVAAVWWGGYQVSVAGLTIGQLIAFVNYLTQALMSLMMVSMMVVRLSRAEASSVRIEEVLNETPLVKDAPIPDHEWSATGRVQFDHVDFSYPSSQEDPVLCDVSFTVDPGQMIAILGATGSGKTSLINLIPRFYDVTNGAVRVDDVDVRNLPQETLRRWVTIAPQDSSLFSGTLRDNIRFGDPSADDGRVSAAAKAAQAAEFIERMEEGFESGVGQHGAGFSGGQKQRTSIARALLPNPAVLLLDDSVSAVDVRTEARIEEAIRKLPCTKMIVTQRISFALRADRILVLDNGRLVGNGTHDELLEACSVYREIYESQAGAGVVTADGL